MAQQAALSGTSVAKTGAVAVAALGVLLASGCQGSDAASGAPTSTPRSTSGAGSSSSATHAVTGAGAPKGAAHVVVTPGTASSSVKPDTTVAVKVTSGTVRSVKIVDAKGAIIGGAVSSNGAIWKASSLLKPHMSYTVTAKAKGTDGSSVTKVAKFTTITPKVSATYSLQPSGTVGVGMPVILRFDSPVGSKSERAQIEKRMSVTTTPAQAGAWGWQDDTQLMWRPASYWKPGTKVEVKAAIQGVKTGTSKYVANSDSHSFSIGPSMISHVNIATHEMTVRRDGKLVRTIPVSTGRPGATTETRSGTKVIMTREPVHVMDSASIGIPKGTPGYYNIVARDAMRVTWTGEFLHSAPWSVGSQGHANVSHGCTNLSPSNAAWMYDHSEIGDVVDFTGSNRPFTADEGIGVWTYSYNAWKARTAL